MVGKWGWRVLVTNARALYMSIVGGRSRSMNAMHVEPCDLSDSTLLVVESAAHVNCTTLTTA